MLLRNAALDPPFKTLFAKFTSITILFTSDPSSLVTQIPSSNHETKPQHIIALKSDEPLCHTRGTHKEIPLLLYTRNGKMTTLETSLGAALTQPELSVMLAGSHGGP